MFATSARSSTPRHTAFAHRVLTIGASALGVWLGSLGVAQAQVASTTRGGTLYAANCAMCHGASPVTGVTRVQLGVSAAVLQSAIAAFPSMRGPGLLAMTTTDLADVAAFIAADVAGGGATTPVAPTTPTTPTTAVDRGQALYAMCAGCHGPTPATGYQDIRKAANSAKTLNAIARNEGGMGALSFVTAAQASDLAAYVAASVAGKVNNVPTATTGVPSASTSGTPTAAGAAPQPPALTVAGGCTLGRVEQGAMDPMWLLMLAGAGWVLGRRRQAV